jgi:hypothetical protein
MKGRGKGDRAQKGGAAIFCRAKTKIVILTLAGVSAPARHASNRAVMAANHMNQKEKEKSDIRTNEKTHTITISPRRRNR